MSAMTHQDYDDLSYRLLEMAGRHFQRGWFHYCEAWKHSKYSPKHAELMRQHHRCNDRGEHYRKIAKAARYTGAVEICALGHKAFWTPKKGAA